MAKLETSRTKRKTSGGALKSAPKSPSKLQVDLANQIIAYARERGYRHGTHLTEQELVDHLDVSRSPIRAALQLLAQRKIFEWRPNHGYHLAQNADEMADTVVVPAMAGAASAERLYEWLLRDRASGKLEGDVQESALMRIYAADRGMLKKALYRLAADGLIRRKRGTGWSFSLGLDTAEARRESYRFRMMVECSGLLEPTFKMDATRLARVRAAHREFLQKQPGTLSALAFFLINAEFHEALASCSGNRFILQAIQNQNLLRRLTEFAEFDPHHIRRSCTEHLEILDALESGDRQFAVALLRRHLDIALDQSLSPQR